MRVNEHETRWRADCGRELTGDGQICLTIFELWFLQEFGKLGADITVSERTIKSRKLAGARVHARRGRFNREFIDDPHMLRALGKREMADDWKETYRDEWLAIKRDEEGKECPGTGIQTAWKAGEQGGNGRRAG